ncbi:glycosyltransferase family 4 protein [Aerococcaceae bacterium WGS1372]
MKILHINSYYSTSGLFSQLYNRQINSDMAIDVYVPISYEFPENRLSTSGEYTTVSRNHHQLTRWVFPLKHHKILKDLLSKYIFESYDLIHAHSLFSNGWLALQLHKKFNIPYAVAVRNADLRTFFQRMPWMRKTGIEILKSASKIVFISKNTYNEIFDLYIPSSLAESLKKKSQIVPNGVNDYWHKHRYLDKKMEVHSPIRIVTTGKIMSLKRFVPLAEMIQRYSDHIQSTELHIIGPSWDDGILRQLEKIPIVTYHGKKDLEGMRQLYRSMDIFAMLSYPETFGLVYVEAMSQGLPVIYTKGEGFDNFFPNKQVGVSVTHNDQMEFNEALDYIVRNYQPISKNAVNAMQQFNWDDIHQSYINIYQSIIKEANNDQS